MTKSYRCTFARGHVCGTFQTTAPPPTTAVTGRSAQLHTNAVKGGNHPNVQRPSLRPRARGGPGHLRHISSWVSGSPPNSRPSGRPSAVIAAISSSVSSNPKTSRFCAAARGRPTWGSAATPSCTCQRRIDLAGRDAVRLGRRGHRRLVERRAALAQRAPRLGADAEPLVDRAHLLLREERVQLDLVDRRRHAGRRR